jgi:hypothetical protein
MRYCGICREDCHGARHHAGQPTLPHALFAENFPRGVACWPLLDGWAVACYSPSSTPTQYCCRIAASQFVRHALPATRMSTEPQSRRRFPVLQPSFLHGNGQNRRSSLGFRPRGLCRSTDDVVTSCVRPPISRKSWRRPGPVCN